MRDVQPPVAAEDQRRRHGVRAAIQEHFELQSVMVSAYALSLLVIVALLPITEIQNWSEIGVALVLQVLVGILLLMVPRLRADRFRILGPLGIGLYLTSVALLRDASTPTAGFGPLVLLPVAWSSLQTRRREFALAVIGVAASYLLPTILVGPPQYPTGGWRAGLLFVVISLLLGLSVMQLVERVKRLVGRLDNLARTDSLTGLFNRRAWRELLRRELSIAWRSGRPLTVVLLDLDRFKVYNDEHGHLNGDRLLQRATQAWRHVLRDTDVLARWGGDEFGLLLPGCTTEEANTLVQRMRAACPDAAFSAGVAEWDQVSPESALLASADRALYEAKPQNRPLLAQDEPLVA